MRVPKTTARKVLIVCSSGGHLDQALLVIDSFKKWDVIFATFDKPDARSRIADGRFYSVHYPTNRNLKNTLKNLGVAIRVIVRERPSLVFSTGAGVAVPFFAVARILGIKTMYLECLDRIWLPTLTAKLIKHLTSYFICQAENQMLGWPNRHFLGLSR